MLHARVSRTDDRPAAPAAARPRDVAHLDPRDLPGIGASPALDLQHRVADAALRGFYAPQPHRPGIDPRKAAVVAGTAIGCWALVFGIGTLLIG